MRATTSRYFFISLFRKILFTLLLFPLLSYADDHLKAVPSDMPGIPLTHFEGWSVTFDGRVNAYATRITGDAQPATINSDGVVIGGDAADDDLDSFRLRTGFNPSRLGLNVRSPLVDGYTMGARLGFYPSIQDDNLKNSSTNLDIREVFFTIGNDNIGEFQVGRSLSLYQREHVVLDISGYGVGATGTGGNGTTAGRVGFGYLYDNFAPAVIYRPAISDAFNLAVGLYDPSHIKGANGVGATVTPAPRLEAEATFDMDMGGAKVRIFGSALWQTAEFAADVGGTGGAEEGDSVTATGLGYGMTVSLGMFAVDLTGYSGQALGTVVMLDGNALDEDGEERDHSGWYSQFHYIPCDTLEIVASFGVSNADETDGDEDSGNSYVELQSSSSLIAIYDFNPWLSFTGEITSALTEYTGDEDQRNTIIALGTIFQW
ncbi:hypothetical protein A9Q99_18965 [Gammaproteobacteria bacterium 45_16_T64]|nr:hypothetical protein A9Q99_18965 [Gammaproteobacteria bacterium 45_16_T64]